MRMVNPDITTHLVRVIPPQPRSQDYRTTYVILGHGEETGDCPLEEALRDRLPAVGPGDYEVTGMRRDEGGWALHWQAPALPDVDMLARQGFAVQSVPFTFPIDLDIRRRVQSAAAEQGITPNAWIQLAILDRLTKGLGE